MGTQVHKALDVFCQVHPEVRRVEANGLAAEMRRKRRELSWLLPGCVTLRVEVHDRPAVRINGRKPRGEMLPGKPGAHGIAMFHASKGAFLEKTGVVRHAAIVGKTLSNPGIEPIQTDHQQTTMSLIFHPRIIAEDLKLTGPTG